MKKLEYDKLSQNGKKWYDDFINVYTHQTSLKLAREVQEKYVYEKSKWTYGGVTGNCNGVRKFKKLFEEGYEQIYAFCKGLSSARNYPGRVNYYIFVK